MPFLNLEWTSNRIQFFGEVDLFSVLSGLLYRNEWSSISGILNYLKNKGCPPFLLLPSATLLSKKTVGYNFKQASAVNQVKKSKTPTLFIHGNQDHFVPTYMALELYNACQAEKKLLIVNDAAHGESYHKEKKLVQSNITHFLEKYVD